MSEGLSYQKSGVDISVADATKRAMADSLETSDARVLNRIGAFASLYDIRFPDYEHPVLVMKMEEPGSKQKLAFQHGRVSSVCYDLIHHLVNDIIVMGAKPLAVQDVIICGKMEKAVVTEIVAAMSDACKGQECALVGGETSEQPGVLEAGLYVLAASIIGVVEKAKVIDGSRIKAGDRVLAAASNGLHTNGYSLVRALMAEDPEVVNANVEGRSFLDAVMEPHRCYYRSFKGLFDRPELHGLAHITGGGIEGNLNRILPGGLGAGIDLSRIRVPAVFRVIRDRGKVSDADMLRTFNLGVGMALVVDPDGAEEIQRHLSGHGVESYDIGEITPGEGKVAYGGAIRW